ncbi:MAG: hypothetical protein ACXVH2_09870 [Methanobacterium sp.]
MRTAKIIVFLCAAVLVILGIYSFIVTKDTFSGFLWTAFGILVFFLGLIRIR